MPLPQADVVLLAVDGDSTRAIFHALSKSHLGLHAVIEKRVPATTVIRRRLKRLGARTVAGQLLFQTLVQRPLSLANRARVSTIAREHCLDFSPIPERLATRVDSANSTVSIDALLSMKPRVIVLSGTRIITRKTLESVPATFINMHSGITPRYRGVHGGYWALVEGRPDLVGTTVHLVDTGIDTGDILEQVFFTPCARDNFSTYPILHLAHGLPALLRQVEAALAGRAVVKAPQDLESKLHYHPTLSVYLRSGVR